MNELKKTGETCIICGHVEGPNDTDRCPVCWNEWEWHRKERNLAKALEMARELHARGRKHWYAADEPHKAVRGYF